MDTSYFTQTLLAEQKDLETELAVIARYNTETNIWEATPDTDMMNEIDDNDAADRFEDFEARSAMVNTQQARLTDVLDALKKIDAGTYGICETSGEQIEEPRLRANPAARTCMHHMSA
jgi:RNA polymerase-binding transcription factor DksA